MANPLIKLTNLSKTFDGEAALHPLDLEITDGEFLTLLGPSGCGKTTLLRLLAGFETPDTGEISIKGQRIDHLPPEQRHVNMVFQSYALFPHMTVFENVAFGLKCQGLRESEIKPRVVEALKRVKLDDLAQRKPEQLSGGQQQRVAMARAVVNEPNVLLLDEPLSALDYHLRRNMQVELKALQRRLGITFVMVTHDQEEALSMSDRIVVMNHGSIEQIGTPRDVYEEPANLYVAGFVGVANILNKDVISATDKSIEIEVASTKVHFKNSSGFKPGDNVNVVIRPEDIKVWNVREVSSDSKHEYLPGTVQEVIYKGSTVDLIVTLADGQKISATEFFDEDDEELEYEIGEQVLIEWQPGWEVVLASEAANV
jgi:spermidine/putrescine transport system ATP-binding protein